MFVYGGRKGSLLHLLKGNKKGQQAPTGTDSGLSDKNGHWRKLKATNKTLFTSQEREYERSQQGPAYMLEGGGGGGEGAASQGHISDF